MHAIGLWYDPRIGVREIGYETLWSRLDKRRYPQLEVRIFRDIYLTWQEQTETRLYLCRDRTLDLELYLENVNKPRMIWTGSTSKKLGLIEPAGSTEVILEVVPQDTGLQVLRVKLDTFFLMRPNNPSTTLITQPQTTDTSE